MVEHKLVCRSVWLGAAVIGAAVAAGCGGRPVTGHPVSATNEQSTTDASPARPRELRLDGRDPCATVPRSQWATFSIEVAVPEQDPTLHSPACFFNSSKAAMGIVLVVTEGIDAWAGGRRPAKPADVAPIEGFPAISLKRPANDSSCQIAVDVAQGQYLMASVVIDLNDMDTVPERCVWAHQFAEVAMKTLVGS